ncbi:hypothetical protein AB6A40_001754 [Gnathostoma spinigerum]|uniref:Uncharacterized protein n=1 Tax=Gnathostoma spinigerum TaxID=75299 RepID=A0ABD6EFE1_9BILA
MSAGLIAKKSSSMDSVTTFSARKNGADIVQASQNSVNGLELNNDIEPLRKRSLSELRMDGTQKTFDVSLEDDDSDQTSDEMMKEEQRTGLTETLECNNSDSEASPKTKGINGEKKGPEAQSLDVTAKSEPCNVQTTANGAITVSGEKNRIQK